MALRAILDRPDVFAVVLEAYQEGVYVLGFETLRDYEQKRCFRDYLQNHWEMAKDCALDEFGVPLDAWEEAPDTDIMR